MRKMSDVIEVAENKLDVPNEKIHFVVEKVYCVAESFAATSLGQSVIRHIDRTLWIVENTAKWSLPQITNIDTDEKSIQPPPLIRPLPWLLFLPALIALRFIRTALSLLLLMCGQSPVTPTSLVHFIQIRRRKLRAIKYHGLRTIRVKLIERTEKQKTQKKTIFSALMNIFRLFMCLPRLEESSAVKVTVKSKSTLNKHNQNTATNKRQADEDNDYDSEDEANLKCDEMLDKYAEIASSEDSNFEVTTSSNSEDMSLEDSEVELVMNKTQNMQDFEKSPKHKETNKPKKTQRSVLKEKHNIVTSSPLKRSLPVDCNKHNNNDESENKTANQLNHGADSEHHKDSSPPPSGTPDQKNENLDENESVPADDVPTNTAQNGFNYDDDQHPLNQISNAFISLKRSKNLPISQTKYGSSFEDTFYSPIASPTTENFESDKRPDMIDGHKLRNDNGEEHSNFVAIKTVVRTHQTESSSSASSSPAAHNTKNRSQSQYKSNNHHKKRSNKNKNKSANKK